MKRLSIITVAATALASLAIGVAWAQNSHFIKCGSNTGIDGDGNYTVNFKIAGLGNNVTDQVTVTADAHAIYACRNNGQKCPNALNKQDLKGPVSASGSFTSGQNGTISNSLTLNPIPGTLNCPNGQKLILVNVSYSNVRITDSYGASCDVTGSVSRTFVSGDCAAQFGL